MLSVILPCYQCFGLLKFMFLMRHCFLCLFFVLGCFSGLLAQEVAEKGVISGRVWDDVNDPLYGATVLIEGTSSGAVTDIDGAFSLKNLEPGTYRLKVEYVSFVPQVIEVKLSAGEELNLEVRLKEEVTELDEVVIEGTAVRNNRYAMLDMKKKSVHVLEGLSVAQMKRLGDNNLGTAMRRVTGVTIEGGQYVYVRGLSDRYNTTYLNGAQVPGLDPDRNTIQMDLFPSHLIDNVVVYKTFSADLPGDFSGGYIDIETKRIPDSFVFHATASLGFNSSVGLSNNFLSYQGGRLDWLGLDDGYRALPAEVQAGVPSISQAENSPERARQLTAATRSFNSTQMSPYFGSAAPNQRYLLSTGNRTNFFGRPLGFMVTLIYNRSFQAYQNGQSGVFKQRGSTSLTLDPLLSLTDNQSEENVLWGGLLGLGYRLAPGHQIGVDVIHNQKGEKITRQQSGIKPGDAPDLRYYTNGLWFTQKNLSALQLNGSHEMTNTEELQWIVSHSISRIYQPDLRFFTFGHYQREDAASPVYIIEPSIGQLPTRYFRDMRENLSDARIHYRNEISESLTLKTGVSYNIRFRVFEESQYRYNSEQAALVPNGNPNEYVSGQNIWSTDNEEGSYLSDATISANNYEGRQQVWATYLSAEKELFDHLTLKLGARYEGTALSLISRDEALEEGRLLLHDILPSAQLAYRPWGDWLVFRTAYGRTIARPSFRELAPFASFDFIGDYLLQGNPKLVRSLIDNIDLSVEYYPQPGETFSLGLFYKHFQQPIERTFNIVASNAELTYRNVDRAQAMGLELGFAKNMAFIAPFFSSFTLGGNFTYMYSWVQIDKEELVQERALNPNASARRPLFGQSPFIVNATLNYESPKNGWEGTLGYNFFGKRLSVVTPGGPNVYELPRSLLDLSIGKHFSQRWKLRFSARNLLNARFAFAQTLNDNRFYAAQNRRGRVFSMSCSYTIE